MLPAIYFSNGRTILNRISLIHPYAGLDWKDDSAIFAIELAHRLDNHFEVELLCGAECGSLSRPLKSILGSNVSPQANSMFSSSLLSKWFNNSRIALENLTSFIDCVTYLLHNPTDLILSHNGYESLLLANLIREIKGTPIIHTQHQNLLCEPKYLLRNLALEPEHLICLNPLVSDYVHRLSPQQSVDTIPYGIDLAEFCPEGKAITTGLSQPCILTVASLDYDCQQRLELTIEAVSRLRDASLLVCGEGNNRDYFQSLGDRLLGSQRFQIKSFAYAQMPQVYRSADIFTCAATQVSGGIKYLEAMACGLPVVATDDAVRRYLIGNGGITCDVTDLDGYANSLQDTWDERRYWKQPRQNAIRFDWHDITLKYCKAIQKTINGSNSRVTALSWDHSANEF